MAGLFAIGGAIETLGIGRRRHGFQAADSGLQIGNDLIDTGDDNNGFGAEGQGGNTVGIAVYIKQLALLGNGVGRAEKAIGREGLLIDLPHLFGGDPLAGAV